MGGSLAGTAFPPPTNLDRIVARPFPVSTTLRSASPKRVAVRQLAIRLRDADDGSNPGFVATQRSSPVLRCVPLIGRGPTVFMGTLNEPHWLDLGKGLVVATPPGERAGGLIRSPSPPAA